MKDILNKIGLVLIFLVVLFPNKSNAQTGITVDDPKAFYQRLQNHIKTANQWVNENVANSKMFIEARNRLRQLDSTRNLLQDQYRYVQKIQNEYEKLRELKNMKVSDGIYLTERLLDESLNPSDYIPKTEYTRKLRSKLHYNSGSSVNGGAKDVYRDFFNYKELHEFNYEELKKAEAELKEAQTMIEIGKLLAIIETCDKTIEMATEQILILKKDKKLKMTDGERLAAMNRANKILMESIQLKQEAQQRLIALKLQGINADITMELVKRREQRYKDIATKLINTNHPNKLRLRNHFSLYKYGKKTGKL